MYLRGSLSSRGPFLQLVVLFSLLFLSNLAAFIFMCLSFWIMGHPPTVWEKLIFDLHLHLPEMIIAQIISSVFSFFIPSIILWWLIKTKEATQIFYRRKIQVGTYFLGIAIVLLSAFFVQLFVIDKETFVFPAGLESFSQSARLAQDSYDKFIETMTTADSPFYIFAVFVMVAIVPAICEEIFFRGIVQKILTKGFNSIHISIIITSIFFGLIHFEFYNFLAITFMGIILGYLYEISKNIFVVILGHFVNNSLSFTMLFLYKKGMITLNPEENLPIYIPLISGLFMILLTFYFVRLNENRSRVDLGI